MVKLRIYEFWQITITTHSLLMNPLFEYSVNFVFNSDLHVLEFRYHCVRQFCYGTNSLRLCRQMIFFDAD